MDELDYSLDVAFPTVSMVRLCNKLPTLASTVGLLRFLRSQGQAGKDVMSDQTLREVAKILTAKWYHHTPLHQFRNPCMPVGELVPGGHPWSSGYETGKDGRGNEGGVGC